MIPYQYCYLSVLIVKSSSIISSFDWLSYLITSCRLVVLISYLFQNWRIDVVGDKGLHKNESTYRRVGYSSEPSDPSEFLSKHNVIESYEIDPLIHN